MLVGRNARAGEAVAGQIRQAGGAAEFLPADLSSLAGVRTLATEIAAKYPRLDVLVNNAGARFDRYAESVDGIELTFATNHLGHFLLTLLLIDCLGRSGRGRVVTVSSVAHRGVKAGKIEWLPGGDHYDRRQAYARAKLANILFAVELARRLREEGIVSHAVDPGIVATRFARNNGLVAWGKHLLSHFIKGELVSAASAADAIVHPAMDADAGNTSGKLFRGRQMIEPSAHAQDEGLAAELWALSVKLSDTDLRFRRKS